MVTKNSINSNIPIELAKGGTNATSFSTATGLVKYDGTSLVTSTTATLDASNNFLNTAQPAFLAVMSGSQLNVTGDGTNYVVPCDTEVFDQGSNYDTGTFTFTAPVTGRYLFTANISYGGITTHTTATCKLTSSNRSYYTFLSTGTIKDAGGSLSFSGSCIADMDVADTMTMTANVAGATKVVDIIWVSNSDPRTWFSGLLLC